MSKSCAASAPSSSPGRPSLTLRSFSACRVQVWLRMCVSFFLRIDYTPLTPLAYPHRQGPPSSTRSRAPSPRSPTVRGACPGPRLSAATAADTRVTSSATKASVSTPSPSVVPTHPALACRPNRIFCFGLRATTTDLAFLSTSQRTRPTTGIVSTASRSGTTRTSRPSGKSTPRTPPSKASADSSIQGRL